MSLTVAILCGGLGTRLRPVTAIVPKSLVEVANKPFIDWQLELLADQGIEHVVLCIGYLSEQIKGHVGTGRRFGLEIEYLCDRPELLGTAGAIRNALPLLGSQFGVLYGDVYPLYDVTKAYRVFQYRDADADAMMVVRCPGRRNVTYEGGMIYAYGRGEHGDAGFSLFASSVFERYTDGSLTKVFEDLAEDRRLAGYEVTEPVYEVGSFEGLAAFKQYVLHDLVPR